MEDIYKVLEYMIESGMILSFRRYKIIDTDVMDIKDNDDRVWNITFERWAGILEFIQSHYGLKFLTNINGDVIGYKEM
jgi:hypothetical protein